MRLTIAEAEQILGLVRPYSPKDLKRAYRSKSKENHPDRGGTDEAFVLVGRAKELLDQWLRGEKTDDVLPSPPSPAPSPKPRKDMGWNRPPPFRGAPSGPHSTATGRRTAFEDLDEPWSRDQGLFSGGPVFVTQIWFDGRAYPAASRVRATIGVSTARGVAIVIEPWSAVRPFRMAEVVFHFGDLSDSIRFFGPMSDAEYDEDHLVKRFLVPMQDQP